MEKTDSRKTGPPQPCICCGVLGPVMARGLREICYWRHRRAGRLHKWPTRPSEYSLEQESALARYQRYIRLTTGPGALSRNRACSLMGISTRTGYRYEAMARQRGESESRDEGRG